jgi:uncharacterized membrane protein
VRFRHILGVLLFAAGAAAAQPYPAGGKAALEVGKPYVEVTSDGPSGTIRATIDIAAPRSIIWQVMTDCALAPKLSPSLKSCRVLARDPRGRWDVRENVSRGALLPSVRNIYRQEYDPPDRITFRRTGGDLKTFEGEWRLAQLDDKVRVTYEARMTAPFAVPQWAARLALRREIPAALLAMRRESVARAEQAEALASAENR